MSDALRKRAIVILMAIVIATFAFILVNALQGAPSSARVTNAFGFLFGPILRRLFGLVSNVVALAGHADLVSYDFFVRKCAHFVEYSLLGAECAAVTCVLARKAISPYIWADLFIVLAVAVTDEFVQLLVGRSSRVQDVLIDFSGGLLGIIVVLVVASLVFRHANRQRECHRANT